MRQVDYWSSSLHHDPTLEPQSSSLKSRFHLEQLGSFFCCLITQLNHSKVTSFAILVSQLNESSGIAALTTDVGSSQDWR